MSGSRGLRRSPPPTAPAPMCTTQNTWAASSASWRGWSARNPAARKDQSTGTRRGARSLSRTTRWRVLGRTITTSKLWRWFAHNQVIHVEDLNIVGMVANRRLARAISDAGWGQFVRIIGEKADRYGRTVHRVSRWLASSKTCSGCGHRLHELPLQVRTWTCPACQAVHDRDHNAAKVILAAGRAERLNDCGARVRPQPVAAVGVEAGSTPTAA